MKCGYVPHFEIPLPKADKAPIQTYTDEELRKLLKKPDVRKCIFSTYRSWVIVNFLLSTGVRQNSLVNIKIRDVDFDNGVVYVNTTKNRKPLIIPLNEDIVKILQEYLQYRGGVADDWLFCSVYGKQLTSCHSGILPCLLEPGKKVRRHHGGPGADGAGGSCFRGGQAQKAATGAQNGRSRRWMGPSAFEHWHFPTKRGIMLLLRTPRSGSFQ